MWGCLVAGSRFHLHRCNYRRINLPNRFGFTSKGHVVHEIHVWRWFDPHCVAAPEYICGVFADAIYESSQCHTKAGLQRALTGRRVKGRYVKMEKKVTA